MHTTAVWSSYHSCQSPLNLSTTSLRCVHHIFGTSNSMFGFYRISLDNNQPILEDLKCQNGLGPRFSLWFLQVRSTMWTSWMASPPGKGQFETLTGGHEFDSYIFPYFAKSQSFSKLNVNQSWIETEDELPWIVSVSNERGFVTETTAFLLWFLLFKPVRTWTQWNLFGSKQFSSSGQRSPRWMCSPCRSRRWHSCWHLWFWGEP